ncbi:MAG: excinuclease ABC subunit UvrA [Planctomycetota bacterium]|jgi:excinuclease ABC subunit A
MGATDIVIKGAREHNLRDVDLVLPRNRLICFTGVSGSGKSSLAFDTLYAEGQRRYVESLSSFARQFLGQMPKPDVDLIAGLSPSISISQKTAGQSPRSTVGTITEVYDYLRVLYARVGKGHCSECGRPITAQTRQQILERIATLPQGTRHLVLAPLVRQQKGEHRDLFDDLLKQGFVRARVDGAVVRLTDQLNLGRQMRHDVEVVVDRITAGPAAKARLAEAVELALRLGEGNLIVAPESGPIDGPSPQPAGDVHLSAHYACTHCKLSFEPPSPQMFSFNSPRGMCPECSGLGEIYTFDPKRLIPDPAKSFQQGAIELIGRWRDLGRWRRHVFRGVAETLERAYELEPGTALETAWEELDPRLRKKLLWGTGEEHVTFTWRSGPSGYKWGGKFEGIIPRLLSQYRTSKSRMQRRMLEKYMSVVGCAACGGRRLNPQARSVTLTTASSGFSDRPEQTLPEVCSLAVSDAAEFFAELDLDETGRTIAAEALKEVRGRLGFLENVGLDYLTLDRTAPTLAGGEMQRIRLAGQIGCGLVGVLYILDEPSIGLHSRDNDRLLETLAGLRDQGNTVVIVEHDEDTMRAADQIVDFGPGPGVRGGRVVATGNVDAVMGEAKSVTGQYLSGRRRIEVPPRRRPVNRKRLVVCEAAHNNLKGIDVEIPLGVFVCVTGVSGSGKSSLVGDILVEALRRDLNGGIGNPGTHRRIEGLEHLDKMIAIDQSPIGRTPRSNPATYIKLFDEIRRLFSQLPDSKTRGYQPGRFSFNVAGGRCESCDGNGSHKLEMDFLADVWVTCPVCEGRRFNRETLQVRYKGKSIADVLDMDVQEAVTHFENVPKIHHKLKTLHDVGLDYMKLGQPSPTLSGGEAQRIKLARELVKASTGQTLYLLDEPTTGLHFADIELLLEVLHGFVNAGNTVLVVEHNLEVVKTADWIVDLGPEGGEEGGRIVASGTPEEVARTAGSHTGKALRPMLNGKPEQASSLAAKSRRRAASRRRARLAKAIKVRGASQHNLKGIDVEVPRDQLTVCCGPSGSGKTSLAMDTIYAEGQRRYVESLSAYARQFVDKMQKPKLEHIEGLSPAIAIEQKHSGHTPRSTVGTVTEIYDYLRILMARLGKPHCPECNVPIGTQSTAEIVAKVMAYPSGTRLYLAAPLAVHVGEQYEALWEDVRRAGYVRIRVDGQTYSVDDPPKIDRRRRHDVEVVVDRVTVRAGARSRIADSVENTLALGRGMLRVVRLEADVPEPSWPVDTHSRHFACDACGRSFEPLSPHNFSFNSSLGWCRDCEGLGVQTGANPAALLHDPKLSLAEGAVALWPAVGGHLSPLMLRALAGATGTPIDVPFDRLGARHRRLIMHGTGDQWFDVHADEDRGEGESSGDSSRERRPLFRFQYKGLYPALEEASRLSPSLRGRLEHLVDEVECSVCAGSRLHDVAAAVQLRGQTIDEICRKPLAVLCHWFRLWELSPAQRKIAGEVVREVRSRLEFLVDVGLEYLTLARPAPTLSGGEMQRIRLAAQVGSGLCGVLYVLDEPTIGLHARDNRRLLAALGKLRDLGNTLLVVEHDRDVVKSADRVLDFGPAAGRDGGQIVARGTPSQIATRRASVTGPYLAGTKAIPVPTNRRMASRGGKGSTKRGEPPASAGGYRDARAHTSELPLPPGGGWLEVIGARHHNLKCIDAGIPLGAFTVITGTSGSGKSSLVDDVLYSALARSLHRARAFAGAHDAIRGLEHVNKVIRVDQQPLGQTPTSNPATFTGVFDLIRSLFAQLPESKLRGYTPRRFSFNVPGGRCEKCEGNGQLKIEMHFLPDVWVECDACRGRRYEPETLAVRYHGQSIADVLGLPCSEAVRLFENLSKIRRVLQTLCDVGLDYLTLGQPAPTLSGGEAQRVKLAAELSRPDTGRTLYLLDEPTTGLHFHDLAKLLDVLNRLVDLGNTVVVIEHNLDVIKTADWVIDMGPEAGDEGGYVVVAGTPEDVVDHARRWTRPSESRAKRPSPRAKGQHKSPASLREGQHEPPIPPREGRYRPPSPVGGGQHKPPLPPGEGRGEGLLRSYTGEVLDPVLSAGPFEKRRLHDFVAEEEKHEGDMEIAEVGRGANMPWEIDGPRWHTQDRVGRAGQPCRWDGRILAEVVDRIEASDSFSPTDWNNRGVVEVRAVKKTDGWFFHALTGEEWLLKMKFRTAKNTFRREELVRRLDLKPLNEMHDLPLYGTEPRVKCKNLRSPWQEVEVRVHAYEEIDRPEFWRFLDQAIAGFRRFTDRARKSPDDLMPWKVLGRKWHLMRKGFLKGGPPKWEPAVLEALCDLLEKTAPGCQFGWTNKVLVPVHVGKGKPPWATIQTKKPDAVHLALFGPKNCFPMGRLTGLGQHARLDTEQPDYDAIHLTFRTRRDLAGDHLASLLREHVAAVLSGDKAK